MATIADLRKQNPGYSDAELLDYYSQYKGWSPQDAARYLGVEAPDSNFSKNLSSAVDRYQAGLETVGAALGSETMQRWADENNAQADVMDRLSTSVKRWDDVNGVGDLGSYLGYVGTQSLPYAAEFAATAGVGGLAMKGTRAALKTGLAVGDTAAVQAARNSLARGATAAGVVGSYPSSLGDVLGNQYEQAGEYDLGYAAPAAAGYAALNAVGPEAMIVRGLARGLPRPVVNSRLGNAAIYGGAAAGVSGAQEVGQEVFNQYGRNAVDPTYDPLGAQAQDAYRESFIAGAALGLVPGSIGGAMSRPMQKHQPVDLLEQPQGEPLALPAPTVRSDELQFPFETATERANAVSAAERNASSIYADRAAEEARQAALNPRMPVDLLGDPLSTPVQFEPQEEVYPTDYTQPNPYGQMSFLDDLPPAYSPVMFDPNLPLEPEAQQFAHEQGGVSGYRGALNTDPASFTNVAPRRDFAIPGARQYGMVDQTPEEFAREQGIPAPAPQLPTEFKSKRQNEVWAQALAATQDQDALAGINQTILDRKFARAEKLIAQAKAEAAQASSSQGGTSAPLPAAPQAPGLFTPQAGVQPTPAQPKRPTEVKVLERRFKEPNAETAAREQAEVEAIMGSLNDKQRQVLAQYHTEKKPFEEIGYELDPAKQAKRDEIINSGKHPRAIEAELKKLDSAARMDARQAYVAAKAKMLKAGEKFGLDEGRLNTFFSREDRRLSGGADVQTASVGQVVQSGAAMHVPGGTTMPQTDEAMGLALDDSIQMPDVPTDFADPENFATTADGRVADEVTDDDTGEAAAAEETTEGLDAKTEFAAEWKDYRGETIQQVDIDDALATWEDLDGTTLPEKYQLAWVRAYIANQDKVLTNEAFGNLYADLSAKIAGTGEAQVQNELPAGGDRGARPAEAQRPDGADAEAGAGTEAEVEPRESRLDYATPSAAYVDLTPAEARFIKSDDFGAYLRDYLAEIGAKWHQRPNVSLFDGQLVVPAADLDTMRGFSEWMADAPTGERASIPPQMRNGTFAQELARAEVLQPRDSTGSSRLGQEAPLLRAALRRQLVNPALFDRRVTIVQSDADVPAQFQRTRPSDRNTKRLGFYDPKTGRVWLIADNIPPGREMSVLLHEVGVHMGMKNLLGKVNYDRLVAQVKEWVAGDGALENTIAKQAQERLDDARTSRTTPLADAVADEELIAYFVEEAVRAGVNPTATDSKLSKTMLQWLNTLWNAVKSTVQKLGINPTTLTARDVVDLAYGAARMELNASETDQAAANSATGRPMGEPLFEDAEPRDSVMTSKPQGAFKKFGEAVDTFMVDPKTKLDEIKLGWMTLEQMADRTKLQSLRDYVGAVHKMQATSKDWVAKAAALDIDWAKLDDEQAEKLGDVMVRSTLAEYDPTTTAPANAEQVKIKADLAAIKGGEDLYKQVRDFYKEANEEKRAILTAAAKKAGRRPAEVEAMFAQIKGPYFPLMRMGDWYAVMMSDEVQALTDKKEKGEATKADELRLSQLRKNPEHYLAKSFPSRSEALAYAKRSGFKNTYVNTQRERISRDVSTLPDFQKFESYIGQEMDSGVRAKLRDMMAEMYFDMLPQSSGLKRNMRREGVAGATFGRAEFARSSLSQSHLLSRLKHSDEVNAAMVAVDKDSSKGNHEARQVYNELQKRTSLAFDMDVPPRWVDMALKGSYFAHLGISPAYWLTNLAQTPMITMPWLAARHGFGAANQALATAFSDVRNIMKSSYAKDGWRFEFDWKDRFPAGSGEDKLFQTLLERNKLDITIEHDLMAIADARNTKMNNAVKFLNTPVRSIELVNRGMTALAAYRLALKKFDGNQNKAIEHAIKAVNDTQLDYSTLNSARHMQSLFGSRSLARVVMQFRKFQQGMIYLVASSAYDALKSADPETRAEAKKTLFGIFATTGLMAGSMGVPAAGAAMFVANLIGKAFDDDDDPFDAETAYKNWLASVLGPDLAQVAAKGLLANGVTNVDLSKRVGMGDLVNPVPFYRTGANGRESANNMLAAVAGAPFGTAANVWDGIVKMGEGDFEKGAEQVIPVKLMQNLIRTGRYATEGMTDTRGNVVLGEDRFSPWDLAMRAIGFQTAEESTYYEANAAVNDAKYAAKKVRDKLIREATKDGIRMTPEIRDFNSRHPNNRITLKTLAQSAKQRKAMMRERNAAGVRVNEDNEDYMDEATFAE